MWEFYGLGASQQTMVECQRVRAYGNFRDLS
jgi:hypothetical protein